MHATCITHAHLKHATCITHASLSVSLSVSPVGGGGAGLAAVLLLEPDESLANTTAGAPGRKTPSPALASPAPQL